MKEEALYYFESPFDLKEFTNGLSVFSSWKVKDGLMNDRGSLIENKPYAKAFREKFKEKGFFRRNVSLAEIVTWIDNISILLRVMKRLEEEVSKEIFMKISISMEYCIRMSKNMRIDFILGYESRILLLEMRTLNGFRKIRSEWNRKFGELLVYKELLCNYCTYDKIVLYAFIALYEYEGNKIEPAHKNYNNNQINFFVQYIKDFLIGI